MQIFSLFILCFIKYTPSNQRVSLLSLRDSWSNDGPETRQRTRVWIPPAYMDGNHPSMFIKMYESPANIMGVISLSHHNTTSPANKCWKTVLGGPLVGQYMLGTTLKRNSIVLLAQANRWNWELLSIKHHFLWWWLCCAIDVEFCGSPSGALHCHTNLQLSNAELAPGSSTQSSRWRVWQSLKLQRRETQQPGSWHCCASTPKNIHGNWYKRYDVVWLNTMTDSQFEAN